MFLATRAGSGKAATGLGSRGERETGRAEAEARRRRGAEEWKMLRRGRGQEAAGSEQTPQGSGGTEVTGGTGQLGQLTD